MLPTDPRPVRRKAKENAPRKETLPPFDMCDGCRRQSPTTVCGICLMCAEGVVKLRRALFPRSPGGRDYQCRRFGREFA